LRRLLLVASHRATFTRGRLCKQKEIKEIKQRQKKGGATSVTFTRRYSCRCARLGRCTSPCGGAYSPRFPTRRSLIYGSCATVLVTLDERSCLGANPNNPSARSTCPPLGAREAPTCPIRRQRPANPVPHPHTLKWLDARVRPSVNSSAVSENWDLYFVARRVRCVLLPLGRARRGMGKSGHGDHHIFRPQLSFELVLSRWLSAQWVNGITFNHLRYAADF